MSYESKIACALEGQVSAVALHKDTVFRAGNVELHSVAAFHLKGNVIRCRGRGVHSVSRSVMMVMVGDACALCHYGSGNCEAGRVIVFVPLRQSLEYSERKDSDD